MVQGTFLSIRFLNDFLSLKDIVLLFKMAVIQTKDLQSNNCKVTAWWQNELVVETSYTCQTFTEGLSLFTAGDYPRILNGEIRNFSFFRSDFFRTCGNLPVCDLVDYPSKSISPGKKIGMITQSGDSRDTFRKIFYHFSHSYES